MLTKYRIILENNAKHREHYFVDALKFIHKYRDLTKGDVPSFFGMRNTWFPGALLRLGTVHHMTDANVIRNSRDLFSKYVADKNTHSWYFMENDVSEKRKYIEDCDNSEYWVKVVYFKAKIDDIKIMNEYLKPIMNMFGLRYKLQYLDKGMGV